MKIIVMWLIVNSYTSGIGVQEDSYGRMPSFLLVPSISIVNESREWRVRIFDNQGDADEFIKNSPPEVKEIYCAVLEKRRLNHE